MIFLNHLLSIHIGLLRYTEDIYCNISNSINCHVDHSKDSTMAHKINGIPNKMNNITHIKPESLSPIRTYFLK